jgi:serine/threonine protein kinase
VVDRARLFPIAQQLLKAITHIHARGICHRDLKPDNIIIDGDQVTLIDFNVAVDVKLSKDGLIEGNTGLKEWSAPETRSNLQYDR